MDRRYILMALLLFGQQLIAQKHDYVWVFGYDSEVEDTLFGGSFMDFKTTPVSIGKRNQILDFYITNASFSDNSGNLLFYTNGLRIENTLGHPVENSEGLNPGEIADSFDDFGYPLGQGALFLPSFQDSSTVQVLHTPTLFLNDVKIVSDKLLLTIIDQNKNEGQGKVIAKNQSVINDILEPGKLTAVKHANGRDWWMLLRKYDANKYHTLIYNPDEIRLIETHTIGDSIPSSGLGQAIFSPDGSKYVRFTVIDFFDKENYLNIYDFDRCSGLLSNPIQFQLRDSISSGGVAISPNNRFLYVSAARFIFQYDLWADNIEDSRDTVALYDGFTAPFPTLFYLSQLGPDGKIYINTPSGSNVLHIIHHPNLKGEACMVEQHGITLPTYNASSLPNFPNYRLGPLEGSPCDTLTVTSTLATPTRQLQLEVYPNPSTGFLYLRLSHQNTVLKAPLSWRLLDALGQEVKQFSFTNSTQEQRIEILDLPNGIYFWELRSLGGVMDSGKLVKR